MALNSEHIHIATCSILLFVGNGKDSVSHSTNNVTECRPQEKKSYSKFMIVFASECEIGHLVKVARCYLQLVEIGEQPAIEVDSASFEPV